MMKVPVLWMKDYVDINDIDEKTLIEKLILTGSNNEGTHKGAAALENVVVGHITEIKQHANADKLSICQVDTGDEVLQIVTGATNIRVNDYVPVAKHGAVIADGIKIKRNGLRKILYSKSI
jgi:phenylalanyl-tRNA synthetase beta chain